MVDLKKQVAFEKHEAQRCNCDYEDLKRHLDRVEALSGHRYTPTSPRSESWIVWSAAWDARQAEIKELKEKLEKLESGAFVLVPKLSANYLFNQVPELGFLHKDEKETVLYHLNYMASEFKEDAKRFVENDHSKQAEFAAHGETHE